jgi:hypothetical protein
MFKSVRNAGIVSAISAFEEVNKPGHRRVDSLKKKA